MIEWRPNLNTVIEMQEWEFQGQKNFKFTPNIVFRENCYKMFYHC